MGSIPAGRTQKFHMKQDKLKSINNALIPKEVSHVTQTLEKAGFEAFVVGGCVRDLIIGRIPKDWDVTTNAKPEQVISLFKKTVYENTFGTVAVMVARETSSEEVSYETVEVTPYRIEGKYTDKRHPDEVQFSDKIEDDLQRRDFTINAMAYNSSKGHLIDLYNGQTDIKDKVIRCVGDASLRFSEDALRMLRAVRFSAELNFAVSYETMEAITEHAELLKDISEERIRDEFSKILMSPDPFLGVGLLSKLGLLKHLCPELEEGIGCEQKGEHLYDVFEHLLYAVKCAADKDWPLEIRLAALMHDIGKPRTRRWDGSKAGGAGKYTFYGHEVVGARMVEKILTRLKYPKKTVELVTKLVRYHMFFSDTEVITLSAVRRIITNVGREHIWELMQIRDCDRAGMKKKEAPYRLRKYHAMIEEALRQPTSVGMLKIDGTILIGELGMKPSPRIGWILHALLEEILEEPEKNTREYLDSRVRELNELSDADLKLLGEKGKEVKEQIEEEEITELRKKHGVK